MKTTYKILRDARNIIQNPDNWTKNAYEFRNGSEAQYCLVGAVEKAICNFRTAEKVRWTKDWELREPALQKIAVAINVPIVSLEGWNDAPGTKHEEVITALSKAMRLAR
jgi:hypothetical protein